MKAGDRNRIIEEALDRAERWLDRANELRTDDERLHQAQMQRLLEHPADKVVLARMIDQGFRSADAGRVADQVHYLLETHGVPAFFSSLERTLIRLFQGVGRHIPAISVPKMIERMRDNSRRVVVDGEPGALEAHLKKRKAQGVRMNVNRLGEALLGEAEAHRRLDGYLADLRNPDIDYISVKISTLYSQIHPLAFAHTVSVLKERLAALFREAAAHPTVRPDGTAGAKFVNLDMEAFSDLEITLAVFRETLELPEFRNHPAGIVLQAYLPESYALQRQLTQWAVERVGNGGCPVKLRIVKGANLEMERIDAALHGWPLAPFDEKPSVDANYRRMVEYGMIPDHIAAVRLGVASHNLFELAYADCLARFYGVADRFTFEMLEGMAGPAHRAIGESGGEVLLYAPVASRGQFVNAIAYLVRRLDENTAPGNFLRHLPGLTTAAPAWKRLRRDFLHAFGLMETLPEASHRSQNRLAEKGTTVPRALDTGEFANEPDTDWSLAANRRWAEKIREKWKRASDGEPMAIPLVVAGREIRADRECRICRDPSRFAEYEGERPPVARFAMAAPEDLLLAVATARRDPDRWRETTPEARHEILSRVADRLRRARGDLIGAAAAVTGKVFTETDPEVSEAVDFAEYYPLSVRALAGLGTVACRGKGVVAVVSPWNFPIAIACGGISAALAAGNTVIFKPSSEAVPVAWEVCRCFWDAGISRNTLQFVPCPGDTGGHVLTGHPDVDAVILTGGTDTATGILGRRPDLCLAAETGGKNATIVTAMADRDQAVKNAVYSAFGNGGQKCSATSLLILEGEVYDDSGFRRQLVDAARSFSTGSAWTFRHRTGPLIHPPGADLERALTRLEPGESWALKPAMADGNPCMWTPGIKWGVRPGSFTHMTELFGPLLGVMRADDLDHAMELAHATGYGLTAGLESLDEREQHRFVERMKAGNLYVNRGTTGAVTLRQPFGGMGKSAVGPGIKAGGPDYVTQFMTVTEKAYPHSGVIRAEHPLLRVLQDWRRKLDWGWEPALREDLYRTVRAVRSYLYRYEQHFSRDNDYFHLRGQDNVLRYLPVGHVLIRLHPDDTLFDVLARVAAGRVCRCRLTVSISDALNRRITAFLEGGDGRRLLGDSLCVVQTDDELVETIPRVDRLRYAAPDRVPLPVFAAAARAGRHVAREPVLMEGRFELLHYLTNQSVCNTYHRYGNLGERAWGGVADSRGQGVK